MKDKFKQTEIGRIPREWENMILDLEILDLEILGWFISL
jgi:hypothetical protein